MGDNKKMIRFTKMHGLGNDYVYVDCLDQSLAGMDVPALARAMSDRHKGIGADGLILICPPDSDAAQVRMEMYNADGSRGEMCGNGIRCVAKFAVEHGIVPCPDTTKTELQVETDRGVLDLTAEVHGGLVESVCVDMGPPMLNPADIPVRVSSDRCIRVPLPLGDTHFVTTCVSLGNPHAVVFLDSVEAVDLARLGPLVEHHPLFPNRVNFHVAVVSSRSEAVMRTWERGTGLTMACGTGACAVLVAGVLEDRLDRAATLHLPGGDLQIEWREASGDSPESVMMTGPATEVFTGQWAT